MEEDIKDPKNKKKKGDEKKSKRKKTHEKEEDDSQYTEEEEEFMDLTDDSDQDTEVSPSLYLLSLGSHAKDNYILFSHSLLSPLTFFVACVLCGEIRARTKERRCLKNSSLMITN